MRLLLKLVRNGNSTQVTVPKAMLEALGWNPGQRVTAELTEAHSIELRQPTISDLRSTTHPAPAPLFPLGSTR